MALVLSGKVGTEEIRDGEVGIAIVWLGNGLVGGVKSGIGGVVGLVELKVYGGSVGGIVE